MGPSGDKRTAPAIHTLMESLELKDLPRSGWLEAGLKNPETVAAHSWGVAWLVLALCPRELDRGLALAMAVIHDLAEVRVGDITPGDQIDPHQKNAREREALRALLAPLGSAAQGLLELWEELEAGQSAEACFVRACDRLDMGLQATHYAKKRQMNPEEFTKSALNAMNDERLQAILESAPRAIDHPEDPVQPRPRGRAPS